MTKQLRNIAAVLFAGVFVLTLVFTLATNSAYAGDPERYGCCEIWNDEVLYLKGVWIKVFQVGWVCTCSPLVPPQNPNNCELRCPPIE